MMITTIDSPFQHHCLRDQPLSERPLFIFDHLDVSGLHGLNDMATLGYRVRHIQADVRDATKVYVLLERDQP